jgi:hypothetical protein
MTATDPMIYSEVKCAQILTLCDIRGALNALRSEPVFGEGCPLVVCLRNAYVEKCSYNNERGENKCKGL